MAPPPCWACCVPGKTVFKSPPPSPMNLAERQVDPAAQERLREAGLPPIAARILAARNVTGPADIDPNLVDLPSVNGGSSGAAAGVLAKAVQEHKHICVIGDYDADGMCATALAVQALQAIDTKVSWLLSGREHAERSLDPVLVNQAIDQGAQLILSVDGGTSAHAGVRAARDRDVPVVVTDHHLPDGDGTPCAAAAIANPLLDDSGLPSKHACGAAVVMLVLREVYRQCSATRRIGSLINLVAVATVADMMPLDDVFNRKVVMAGLDQIRKGRCRPAFKAMLWKGAGQCTARTVGYTLAPQLNAANRMGKPHLGVEALLTDNMNTARQLVAQLSNLNRQRRLLDNKATQQAFDLVDGEPGKAIVVHQPNWHHGIIGIVANRLADFYDQPAIALCGSPGDLRGSGRTARNISVHAILKAVAAEEPELLGKWGGHAAAAGVRVVGDLQRFRELFQHHTLQQANQDPEHPVRLFDGTLNRADLCDGSFQHLANIPWGKNFPPPLFSGEFVITESSPAANGRGFNHKLSFQDLNFPAWSRTHLGRAGQVASLLYQVTLDSHNPGQLFILPKTAIPR